MPLAAQFRDMVRAHAVSIDEAVIGTERATPAALQEHLHTCDTAVVFGGDGTVHSLLAPLIESGRALYHVPIGTENLFARQFGMSRDPRVLVGAIRAARIEPMDVAEANARLFAIMCSAGPDASVVHRLAARRSGAIRHASYARPIIAELFRPSLGPYRVEVDGEVLVDGGRGLLVVANSAMYALGINPCARASMHDGMLDVLYLPARSSVGVAAWFGRAFLGDASARRAAVWRRGRDVVISGDATPYQLDGDEGGIVGGESGELRIRVRPAAARVLDPRE